MNPYIRAASKHPKVKQQALERLSKRPEPPRTRQRARHEDGTFQADNPNTPEVDEAWET
jgi:hypothetical protein